MTPLDLRARGLRLGDRIDAYARDRAGLKLGKFASRIERVAVRFHDVNGPRGGVDTECRVRLVMSRGSDIIVRARATASREAYDRAIDMAERALRRELGSRHRAVRRAGRRARTHGRRAV